jgi:hypothetical protein
MPKFLISWFAIDAHNPRSPKHAIFLNKPMITTFSNMLERGDLDNTVLMVMGDHGTRSRNHKQYVIAISKFSFDILSFSDIHFFHTPTEDITLKK